MHEGHAQLDVAEMAGTEGLDLTAGDARVVAVERRRRRGGTEEGIVQPPGEGIAEGVVRGRGRDLAHAPLPHLVVGVYPEGHRGGGVAHHGLVEVRGVDERHDFKEMVVYCPPPARDGG